MRDLRNLLRAFAQKTPNIRVRHPLTDHLEDLFVTFIGVVESRGVDKNELVAVCSMTEDPMRGDFVGYGFKSGTCSRGLTSEGVDDLFCERLADVK